MTKAALLMNPASGQSDAETYKDQLNHVLSSQYDQFDIIETDPDQAIEDQTSQLADAGYEAIYLMGGDGTINGGIAGISDRPKSDRPKIGVIPQGTVNNFARMLGMSTNVNEAIDQLKATHTDYLDLGQINDQYFVSSVSAGAIPETVQDVDDDEKEKLGPLAYIIEGVKALGSEETYQFNFDLDGEQTSYDLSMLVVGLGNSMLGIENFFADQSLQDGTLALMGLKETSVLEKISVIPDLFKEEADYSQFLVVKTFEAGTIDIVSDQAHPTTVDGDQGPDFPIKLACLPKHIEFILPDQAAQGVS
ncbi:hypothetical protein AWM75_02860 [Aerococcus urinaehominis]|uniref:Uncharacterized protein n=1 Tax=Aerococcus urinaehominis TaxID=128944 RepID=A0A0X8FKI3_9LACT|nr:diacylglycerol kinase family protein [Aerococcus urinaehominis]AMB99001.1 hypothetical protein AWM75_02860 [Aerococcus urinaehominis]SDM61992.1 lipid kinase, YegS/Rv2252/BmrU family [Aerococcus urinaehominis]